MDQLTTEVLDTLSWASDTGSVWHFLVLTALFDDTGGTVETVSSYKKLNVILAF